MNSISKFVAAPGIALTIASGWALFGGPGVASAASCNTAATGSWASNCTVQEGDSSHLVEVVQMIVSSREVCSTELGSVDGDFGPRTRNAVECFQRLAGLQADGIVGPQTWKALQAGLTKCSPRGGWQYWSPLGECPGLIGRPDPIADWISTGKWYLLSPISGRWRRMDTGAPS